MVHTRRQKAKEEHETKLAEQRSLSEQSQSASVRSQSNDELEATFASQQDTTQPAISQPNIAKHDSSEQITAGQTIAEQGIPTYVLEQVAEQILERNRNISEVAVAMPIPIPNTAEQNATGQVLVDHQTGRRLVIIPENNVAVNAQMRYGLRERSKTSIGDKAAVAARLHLPKSSKPQSTKRTRARTIAKGRDRDNEKARLIVKLPIKGEFLSQFQKKTGKPKKVLLKRVKTPKGFFTNKYRFKLRWTPFKEYPKVDQQTYQDVYDLLANSLAPLDISLERKPADPTVTGESQGPLHASDAVTVDAVVKVIMSQATDNDNALLAQARLIKAFPYTVNGTTVVGKMPNYHDVRTADPTKLADVLAPAGLHIKRAAIIPECLEAIRQKNINAGSPGCHVDSNPSDASEFVPGSLSLDYLSKLNAQDMFDGLTKLPGIGVKTACCIMAFNFQLPVFAVDTHVFRMVKWLGWIPEGCNRNDAAAHLDSLIPDNLKYGLHQGFWHHGQKCLRCMAKNDPDTKGWEEAVCVIEQYVKRGPKRERKPPSPKRKRENDDDVANNEGTSSPKAKTRKANKTLPFTAMTAEEAAEQGYELAKITREDNFDTAGANVSGTIKKWVKSAM